MANINIGAGEVSSGVITPVANTADTVTFTRPVERFTVVNHDGTDWLYFTIDGSTPTVGGKDTYPVPAAVGASVEVFVGDHEPVIGVIAATACKYIVTEGVRQ